MRGRGPAVLPLHGRRTPSDLTNAPSGDFVMLTVNGMTFLPVGPTRLLRYRADDRLADSIYTLNSGDEVAAAYTHFA
jgi:hypothetical protein